jgi:hypothetical protein
MLPLRHISLKLTLNFENYGLILLRFRQNPLLLLVELAAFSDIFTILVAVCGPRA